MRVAKAHPEEEGVVAGSFQKLREVVYGLRVPVKLALAVGAVMRLSHVAGEVALFFEERRQQDFPVGQRHVQVLGARGVRILAREDADARGAALRRGQKGVFDAQTSRGQAIYVGRGDGRVAVDAEVAPAGVVGDEDQHVGRGLLPGSLVSFVARRAAAEGYREKEQDEESYAPLKKARHGVRRWFHRFR